MTLISLSALRACSEPRSSINDAHPRRNPARIPLLPLLFSDARRYVTSSPTFEIFMEPVRNSVSSKHDASNCNINIFNFKFVYISARVDRNRIFYQLSIQLLLAVTVCTYAVRTTVLQPILVNVLTLFANFSAARKSISVL